MESALKKHAFIRALGQTFISRAIFSAALLAIGILTARLLGPEGRGHYALFFTIVGIGANLGGFGLTQSNTYFLNRERVPMGVLFGNTFFTVCVVGLVSGSIIAIMKYPDMGWGAWSFYGWLLWLALMVAIMETHIGGLSYGSHLFGFQASSMVIQAALLFIATLLIIPFGTNWSVALDFRVVASLIFLGGYVLLFASKVSLSKVTVNVTILRKQLQFGLKNWFQNLVGILNYRGYLLVLATFSEPESIGYFSIALLFAEAIRFVPEAFSAVLLPRLVSMLPGDGPGQLTARVCRIIVLCMAIFGIGLIVILDWLVPTVFGSQFSSSISVTQFVIFGAVIGTVYQLLTRYFTSEHAQWYSIAAGCAGLLVALAASIVLVPKFHALGAGGAYLLCSLTTFGASLWGFRKRSKLSPFLALVPCKQDWLIIVRLMAAK